METTHNSSSPNPQDNGQKGDSLSDLLLRRVKEVAQRITERVRQVQGDDGRQQSAEEQSP